MVAFYESLPGQQGQIPAQSMKSTRLNLSEIVTTAGTQIRAKLCTDTVDDYAIAMDDGAEFPPVVVFHDGNRYILADGFHRVMAASRNGYKDIKADIRKGSKSDALRFALSANATHGTKRTNADKHRSVELALTEWPKVSDREIAKICAVSNVFVSAIRKDIQLLTVNSSEKRIGADGKERKLPKRQDYICGDCGDAFSEKVWHCTKCDHHWTSDVKECKNCLSNGEFEDRPHVAQYKEPEPEPQPNISKGIRKLNEQKCLDHITAAILQFEQAFPGSKELLIADLETHVDRLKNS